MALKSYFRRGCFSGFSGGRRLVRRARIFSVCAFVLVFPSACASVRAEGRAGADARAVCGGGVFRGAYAAAGSVRVQGDSASEREDN